MGRVAIIPSAVGYHWEELYDAYEEFKKSGWDIDIFTIDGSPAHADRKSLEKNYLKSLLGLGVNASFSPDTALGQEIAYRVCYDMLPVHQLYTDLYDAVYIPGGHGALFDVNIHPVVHEKLLEAYHKDKILSAVCHGTSAFAFVRLDNGRSIVENKKLTGFPEVIDDILVKLGWVNSRFLPIPFSNEEKMREAKANITWVDLFLSVLIPWYTLTDSPFVTGVGPKAAGKVARRVIKLYHKKPALEKENVFVQIFQKAWIRT